MAIAVRNEGAKVNSNINVTPMVDVMLVLLIVFMVITPMLQNKVNIELAKVTDPTSMPDADKEDSVVVAITRDSKVYLGQNQVSMADLGARSCAPLQERSGPQVWVPRGGRKGKADVYGMTIPGAGRSSDFGSHEDTKARRFRNFRSQIADFRFQIFVPLCEAFRRRMIGRCFAWGGKGR